MKEGCKIERSQLDDVNDLQKRAALMGVIAIRLMHLRDRVTTHATEATHPKALRKMAPPIWIEVVARIAKLPAETLTPKQFLLTIARRGGYLARKNDPRPGWKVLWQGWYDLQRIVEGAELMRAPPRCG